MRQQDYPGSEIVIEETLGPGANYDRYIASYRSDGMKIFALLTVPRGEKPESGWPVIVFNHGYIRPDQYRTTERYVAYVDGFARNGYIVFRSDYRGHGDSEGAARGGYGTPDYTIDVLNAVAAIKGFEDADPERVGMWGHSMGGGITLRVMVTSDDIKAGVIWAGVVASYSDLITSWARRGALATSATPFHGRSWRLDMSGVYGSPAENPGFWDSISASAFLQDLSGPLQLHHGTADQHVPIEFSAALYDQIQAVGGSVEFFTYEGDNHDLSNYFSLAMQRSIAFFDTYVKGSAP
jgi:dipeptidyl aminopeptidase/acylaminoacyl peptidase